MLGSPRTTATRDYTGLRSREARTTRTSTHPQPPYISLIFPPLWKRKTLRRLSMPSTSPSRHLSFSRKTVRWLWCSCPQWRSPSRRWSNYTTTNLVRPAISGYPSRKAQSKRPPYLSSSPWERAAPYRVNVKATGRRIFPPFLCLKY